MKRRRRERMNFGNSFPSFFFSESITSWVWIYGTGGISNLHTNQRAKGAPTPG